MKKTFIFCAVLFCSLQVISQTLFTYGADKTSKEEFLRAYNKNKPSTTDKEKSLREYFDLYSNFKLKVKAAKELRLDTIPQIKYDVQNFKDQIIDNYMNDEKGLQVLVDEAANRCSRDIQVLYFFIPVAPNTTPIDTLKAYDGAKAMYKSLQNADNNYKKLAEENTAKYAPTKFADAGFITVFSLPYDLENIIYKLKVGSINEPYRNTKGWFILKNIGERPAIGKWKVAQLLFAFPPNAEEVTKKLIKVKADSVYNLILNGMPFAEAAKQFSDDRMTYLNGGELQEFATGNYNASFETNVIALKKDGDVTKPFETSFGFHIVKRLSQKPIPQDLKDATFLYELKQKVGQDARINNERVKFINTITQKTGYKRTAGITDLQLFTIADTIFSSSAVENNKLELLYSNKVIARFADGTVVKGNEWITFLKNNKPNGELPRLPNKIVLNNFNQQAITNYYKRNLEAYNSDFKYQMQEFKEGNMLFEIMERNVWSRASVDSSALRNYYETNKQKYTWAASADVLILNGTDEKKMKSGYEGIKSGMSLKEVVEKSNNQIQSDSGRYELSQITSLAESVTPEAGKISPIIVNKNDGAMSFIKFIKMYSAGLQRSFNEARGLVINDYQAVLEAQWLDLLKKKFPIKLNEAVFKELLQ
jgi:peptidyl-prolyl cis-trans isomerase SurA